MRRDLYVILSFACLSAIITWAHWPAIEAAADRWANDPQYSHGYLVPLFSVYLLYYRRHLLSAVQLQDFRARDISLGFALLAFGTGLCWFGTVFFFNGLDILALLPSLLGMALVLGGVPALKWSWPAIGFLIFMVPLPFQLQTALAGKLQSIATLMSTYALQTIGTPAVNEGNVIFIDEVRIGVVEACSGLGMIVTFAALSCAMAMVIQSPIWVRIAIVLGAIPVAIVSNVIRITLTGLFYHWNYGDTARAVFHDFAGWIMMPIAVLLIMAERFILDRLVVDAEDPGDRSQPGLPIMPAFSRSTKSPVKK